MSRNDAITRMTDGRELWPPAQSEEAERIRAHIIAGTCPWCEGTRPDRRGPWHVIASHTNQAHGVDAAHLRELAELFKASQICSEEHHLRRHAQTMTQDVNAMVERMQRARDPHAPRVLSSAAVKLQSAKSRSIPSGTRRTAGQKAAAKRTPEADARRTSASRRRKEAIAAAALISHGGNAYTHGCRCDTCRAYRRWVKGRGPKPEPSFTPRPCHPGCVTCDRQLAALGTTT